ncbi:hypothetical protein ACP275_12G172900 [Erythranthe tilingii]
MAKYIFVLIFFVFVTANLTIAAAADSEEKNTIIMSRKLGNSFIISTLTRLSTAEAPQAVRNADVSGEENGPSAAAAQEQMLKINHRNHHGVDKSIAGGGVILGGLATTFLVAVFCYIRATGRKYAEPASPTYSSDASKNVTSSNSPAICA